jgi:hypothetical protein
LSDTAHTNDEQTAAKPRRSLASRLFRLTALTGLVFLLLFAGGIGFTETASFRSLLRDFLTETADSTLNASLSIESIDGNIFSGWKLSGVRLADEHGSIAEIRSIVLRYNLFRLPWKVANIRELTLNAPRVYVTRAEGRDWNIDTMLRPSAEDEDTTSTPFDWDIRVEHLRILDGMLLVYDSSSAGPLRRDRLDSRHMKLTDINLALSAQITGDEKRVSIDRFSFSNAFGEVALRNLAGDILLTTHSASVDDLSLQTARSGFILSAAVDSVDILGGFDSDRMADLPIRVELDAPNVVLRDLQYFLPSLDILGSSARLALDAEGSLRSLDIAELRLEAERSSIAFTGRLRDILDGADMSIDVTSDDTRIHGQDIPLLLPGIPVLDLEGIDTAEFTLLRFTGKPLNFEAAMDMTSGAGAASGRIALDITGEDLVYDGMVRTRELDLSRLLRSSALSSSLTLQAAVKGRGTRIGDIVAQLNVRADSSRYQRYLADNLRLSVDVRRDSLTLDLSSRLGGSSVDCGGGMSFRSDSVTGFRISGSAETLDLAKLLNDDEFSSALTFGFHADGDGVDLGSASGSVEVAFAPSRFREIDIERDTFRVVLKQGADDAEYLLLQSQYADARIDGRFDFPRFFSYLAVQADSISAAMEQFAFAPDSLSAEGSTPFREPGTVDQDSRDAVARDTAAFMDVFYSISLKNPERIARYFDARTFLVRGTYRGNIHGGYDGFSVDGQLQLSDFYLVDSTRTLLAAGVRCNYDIRNLQLENPLQNVTVDLRFSASDMHLNGLRLSRTAVEFAYADARPSLRVRSMVDTLLQLDLQAAAEFRDYGFDVQFPVLRMLYLKQDWRNEESARLRIDSTGVAVQQFALRHGPMRLSLSGTRSFTGENDFTLYGDSLDVGMVEYLATGDDEARAGRSFAGNAFVEASVGGTDAAPLMAAEVYIDSLGYRGMHFGEIVLEARYFDRQLELYSELDYDQPDGTQEKVFFLSGTVPADISFSNEESAENAEDDQDASLRLRMREFPLALIEDFLGFFSPLNGTAFGDVTVSGTAQSPSFDGYLTISNARGRFVFNNMEYLLNLRIEAVEQNIRIIKAAVENVPSDWREGRLSASGSISTDAFAIDEFDLAVEGKLKVLQPASRSTLRALFGDLYISTGAEELTYTGRLDRSRLTGNLVVERGNLTFPLEQSGTGVNEYDAIKYVVVDDTTRQVVSSLSAGRFGRLASGTGDDGAGQAQERSVLDGLSYDLRLSTDGRLVVRIPFSVLQEELNAALEFDDLKVSSFGGDGMTFVGEVQLGPESSFLFLGKRLSADGSLYFTRDPMNPDLDLQAVYSDYYINPETEVNRKVYVVLKITGTKNKPKLEWDLRWDAVDGEPVAAAGDVQSDASSFLIFGVFASDISANEGESSSLAAKSPELVNQLGSSIASTAVTQLFNRLGFEDVIKRIDFSGIGTENSRVKLTSEIGQSIITYDGKIDNYRSSNLTVEFPLSRIVGVPWLNQVIQISRITTNNGVDNPAQPTEYSVWELKILQRFSF